METDSEGWQKLPLHLEMEMMQQAARGEDGGPPDLQIVALCAVNIQLRNPCMPCICTLRE